MKDNFFITGIGTGIGKTIVSAILTHALDADYWKPVQAGDTETDSRLISTLTTGTDITIHPEVYPLKLPASPHIAAREEGISIDIKNITRNIPIINRTLIIEGAGGLLVPLNGSQFVSDLIIALGCRVILVSRNYLGSINHSLLTAKVCHQQNIPVAGWIFNDQYMDYEEEIVYWSGYPKIASVPFCENPGREFIMNQASVIRNQISLLYAEKIL